MNSIGNLSYDKNEYGAFEILAFVFILFGGVSIIFPLLYSFCRIEMACLFGHVFCDFTDFMNYFLGVGAALWAAAGVFLLIATL